MNEGNNSRQQRIATLLRILVGILSIASVFIVAAIPATIYQVSQPVTVEWEPEVRGPPRSFVWAVALDPLDPGTIYAGTNGGGVYKSTDNGMTWDQKNDGLVSAQGLDTGVEHAHNIRDILVSSTQPGVIYVATWGPEGIYRSDDGGETWMMQLVDVLLTDDEADRVLTDESVYVRVLLETETAIFAGTKGGVFQLTDLDVGLWQPTSLKGEDMSIRALLVHPHYSQMLYAATLGQGIYKSEDGGETWREKNNGLGNEVTLEVNALIFDQENSDVMYAGTFGDGVYRSLDGGESWDAWSDGLPEESDVWSLHFAADGTLFVGLRFKGTYKRTELEEWKKASFLSGALTLKVDSQTGAIYAGTWGGGLYRNENEQDESPQDWQNLELPREYPRLRAAVFVPPALYVGTDSDGVYASQNGGQNWERCSQGLEGESLAIRALAVAPDGYTLYAGTGAGVFVSADGGQQWDPLGDNPLPNSNFSIASLAVDGHIPGEQDVVYAGMEHAGLWTFDRNRQQWDGPQEFEHRTGVRTDVSVQSLLVRDRAVYASLWGLGVYKSPTEGPWPSVEMSPKYVDTLTLADKAWLPGLFSSNRSCFVRPSVVVSRLEITTGGHKCYRVSYPR